MFQELPGAGRLLTDTVTPGFLHTGFAVYVGETLDRSGRRPSGPVCAAPVIDPKARGSTFFVFACQVPSNGGNTQRHSEPRAIMFVVC